MQQKLVPVVNPAGMSLKRKGKTASAAIKVSSRLTWRDILEGWKVRWGIGRNSSRVEPGLYALGSPDRTSPVLVSANYKLSFDVLRAALPDCDAWILVLDTKGINVWCAAGKGTFGTRELVRQIGLTGLESRVEHRQLILPQLGATGVSAHEVKKLSGFKVVYGPVLAADLPAFLAAGNTANEYMRTVTFTFRERLVLIPLELVQALKFLPVLIVYPLVFQLLDQSQGFQFRPGEMFFYAGSLAAGAAATPLLLPWIPGRAFSLKGWIVGAVYALAFGLLAGAGPLALAGYLLTVPAVSAFLALNFTGASTYTSLSGVKREMKFAVPGIIVSAAAGLAVNIAGLFL